MPAIITVRAELTPAEILRFPYEDGEPAANGEWEVVDVIQPGQTVEFIAHARKAILVRSVPVATT